MNNILISILLTVLLQSGISEKIKSDETLIAPGIGAEKILLGENIATAFKALQENRYKLSKFRSTKEIYTDIFKVNSKLKIFYDRIHYFNLKSIIIFSRDGIITAIAGLKTNRITTDSVPLNRGVENFIFNYGNENISEISNNRGKIYISIKLGIALFDDKDDDKIDLYLIFKTTK